MKIDASELIGQLIEAGVAGSDQASYLQSALARVLGYALQIPAEPTAEPQAYFKATLEGQLAPVLDAVLQRVPVDYTATLDLIRQIWMVRYQMVHPTTPQASSLLLDACLEKGLLSAPVAFTDPAVLRLTTVIAQALDAQ